MLVCLCKAGLAIFNFFKWSFHNTMAFYKFNSKSKVIVACGAGYRKTDLLSITKYQGLKSDLILAKIFIKHKHKELTQSYS